MSSWSIYKRMLSFIRPYCGWLILSIFLSLAVVAFNGLSYWFSVSMVQSFFKPESLQVKKPPALSYSTINDYLKYQTYLFINRSDKYKTLQFICIVVAISFLLKNLFGYMKNLLMTKLNLRIVMDIRNQLYRHILMLPVSYHDRNKSGSIVSLLLNDVTNINTAMTNTFEIFLTDPLMLLGNFVILLILNPKLTLIVCILFPLFGFIIGRIGQSVRRRAKRSLSVLSALVSILNETVGCIRVVKMFNMNEYEIKRFRKANIDYNRTYFRAALAQSISSPLVETLGAFMAVFLLWYGGSMVLQETSFQADDFLKFILFLFASYQPFKSLSKAQNMLQTGVAAADRVFRLMDEPTEPIYSLRASVIPKFEREIRFKDVHFTYPFSSNEVIRGISFSVPKSSIVAIVGPSGSGKSTILDLASRFYDISSGVISIDDVDIRDMDIVALRHLFGIVAQDTVLFNDTVYNNIAYSVDSTTEDKVIEAAKAANAWEFIEKLPKGLYTEIGENGTLLSGGQRQRLSIARALLKNPPILILDEATSSLDTESERLVQAAINNLIANRTVIVVAHRISTIKHANNILVLEQGKIVEQGTHNQLIRLNGRYRQLYEMQFTS